MIERCRVPLLAAAGAVLLFGCSGPTGAPGGNDRALNPEDGVKRQARLASGAEGQEYLETLQAAIRSHADMMSTSFTGARTGDVVLDVVIDQHGMLLGVSVLRSSGYPDIDARAKELVSTAGQNLPPLREKLLIQTYATYKFSLPFPLSDS